MGYYLLTGATGLLGRYLLRNLLQHDLPVAVVVRGNHVASAWQRVESVVHQIECVIGRPLPRPVVLEGELTQPRLGLGTESLAWVKRHCTAVLHNAASLSFQQAKRDEEPWVTNVNGTQRVLELMQTANIRELHHVSTAYVCGQRRGVVTEHELDLGQPFGNDYEASKLEGEQMVLAASWLDNPTIYRPAIIVGDSRTAFTNTFHGFYTPLQIVHAMTSRTNLRNVEPQSLVEALGLKGHERKNLVPVDWVAAAIVTALRNPGHHGQVYHLTPREPTLVSTLCEVFAQSIRQHVESSASVAKSTAGQGMNISALARSFRNQMSVYQAYWHDDPQFDAANTIEHLPELPCPTIDRATLVRLCQFALDHRFWWSRGEPVQPQFDVQAHLARRLLPMVDAEVDDSIYTTAALRVSGCGGGAWRVFFKADRPQGFAIGMHGEDVVRFFTHVNIWQALADGKITSRQAVTSGAVAVESSHLPAREAEELLSKMCKST